MILLCEPSEAGWSCRAGWDLRLCESAGSPEAAFRRLCLALGLDPAAFQADRRGEAVRFEGGVPLW